MLHFSCSMMLRAWLLGAPLLVQMPRMLCSASEDTTSGPRKHNNVARSLTPVSEQIDLRRSHAGDCLRHPPQPAVPPGPRHHAGVPRCATTSRHPGPVRLGRPRGAHRRLQLPAGRLRVSDTRCGGAAPHAAGKTADGVHRRKTHSVTVYAGRTVPMGSSYGKSIWEAHPTASTARHRTDGAVWRWPALTKCL